MKHEKRTPDSDLQSALNYNPQPDFKEEDVDDVLATVSGENDGASWYWIIKLKSGDFYLVTGSCDYTGWDCQSGASSWKTKSAKAAA